MEYNGLLSHSGRRVVSQGPQKPELRKLEPPGDYLDPNIEKPLWHVLKRWNSLFDFDPLLSKMDAIGYLRMRALEDPEGFPDWHRIADWVREWLREEGYGSTGKTHFLKQPEVEHLHDPPEDDLDDSPSSEEQIEELRFSHHDTDPDLEKKAREWFLTGIFWSYLEDDPELREKCQDIIDTKTLQERANRWGYETRGGAQRYAHNDLRKRLSAIANGKAVKVLKQLQR